MISLEARRGRLSLHLGATLMGGDLCVALSGGDRAHIGAVALSQARASLQGNGLTRSSTSVITLTGHKEDELARALASRLAESLDATVCVACGIHLDHILPEEREDVVAMAEELALDVIKFVRASSGSPAACADIPAR